jgi:hypothetical protein
MTVSIPHAPDATSWQAEYRSTQCLESELEQDIDAARRDTFKIRQPELALTCLCVDAGDAGQPRRHIDCLESIVLPAE